MAITDSGAIPLSTYSRPFSIRYHRQIDRFIKFFNLFNRNNPGANFAANIAQLPVPADEMHPNENGITNVTQVCAVADWFRTEPITDLKQLEVPEGALGDFYGPGTTVGVPFAAQLGIRVAF